MLPETYYELSNELRECLDRVYDSMEVEQLQDAFMRVGTYFDPLYFALARKSHPQQVLKRAAVLLSAVFDFEMTNTRVKLDMMQVTRTILQAAVLDLIKETKTVQRDAKVRLLEVTRNALLTVETDTIKEMG